MAFSRASYLSCNEIIDSSDGAPFISGGSRNYFRRFHVIVNNKGFGPNAICSCPVLPKPYSIYQSWNGTEYDELAVLVRWEAKRKDSDEFYHWIATATYSTEVPEGGIPALTLFGIDSRGSQNRPWDERPVVDWDWDETTYAPLRDLDGKAYINSAYMPYVPAPTFPTARNVLVIRRNEPTFDRSTAQKYRYAVNSDVFLGAAPGTVLCKPPRVKPKNRGSLQFYEVTYRLVFNLPKLPDPPVKPPAVVQEDVHEARLPVDKTEELQSWQPELLDIGTHRLQKVQGVPFTNRAVPIIRYGSPVNHPMLLDGAGRELKPNADGVMVPKYNKFRQLQSVPFKKIIERGIFGGV